MTGRLTAAELLDREFPEIRCRLIDIAAALDRIDRAAGAGAVQVGTARPGRDPRWSQLREASAILIDTRPDRAQRMQMVFSDAFDPTWRETKTPGNPYRTGA